MKVFAEGRIPETLHIACYGPVKKRIDIIGDDKIVNYKNQSCASESIFR